MSRAAVALLVAVPLAAAAPARAAGIVETTPGGYTLHVHLSHHAGRLTLSCPSGRPLGSSARFRIVHGRFVAARGSHGRLVFRFRGRLDEPGHVAGHGTVRLGACGAGITASFAEGRVGTARMVSCPASTPELPLAPDVPYPFAGVVPNAARGTRLRLEYTDPNSPTGAPAVVHLVTDASGRFTDTHAFPASGGEVYGATAIPRHPDDPLASGDGCDVEVQG